MNILLKIFILFEKALFKFRRKLIINNLNSNPGIKLKDNVLINGQPIISVIDGGVLEIDNDVLINSDNSAYHINMHSPVKILIDRQGAKVTIGKNTRIHGSCIHATESIQIGEGCLIAANCHIIDNNGHDLCFPNVEARTQSRGTSRPVTIGDNVWIGGNTYILPGVTIHDGSVVAANSVVSTDVPPMSLVGGNPAKLMKSYQV